MNGPIQIIPQGLLGLLNLKNNGQMPSELGTSVMPQLDMLELYVNGLLEQVSDPVAVAAVIGPNASALVVPQTQCWFVRSLFITTDTIGAGEAITIQPAISIGGIAFVPMGDKAAGVPGDVIRVATTDIIVATPGTVFGFFVQQITGAVNVNVQALIARVRV